MFTKQKYSSGQVNGLLIATVCLSVLAVGLLGAIGWLYVQYDDQKTNVDSKIDTAVIEAKKVQADDLEAKFTEREKLPNREFVGPEDYGLVTFKYPKTWSVYVDEDASNGGDFEAYLNPGLVPSVSDSQQYALRVTIEDSTYDDVISGYDSAVSDGELRASSVTSNGNTGTRFDGVFSNDIRGAAVVFKIRDKTLTVRTDAQTFIKNKDFERIVASIKINK